METGGLVCLKVYDILGNKIKTLVNEEKSPGIYEVEFNSTSLSSGVYFYTLDVNGYSETKSMVLLK
ncbi:MAG: T9SS type A sorting domain-containing protein [Ignavibacteria bacterium]|nr:T9SS type A sorting domain-containing protein [Ignavibacteria bacterium]